MPLTQAQMDRANNVLSGPLQALQVKPDVLDGTVADTAETLAQFTEDFFHVIGSCVEVQADCGVDHKAVARLLWLHGNLFELYRALVDKRP